MTRFAVTWHPDAEAELVEVWLSAPDRAAITAAVQAIDAALADNAAAKGSRVAEGLRVFHAPPLRVLFVAREARSYAARWPA